MGAASLDTCGTLTAVGGVVGLEFACHLRGMEWVLIRCMLCRQSFFFHKRKILRGWYCWLSKMNSLPAGVIGAVGGLSL